MATTTSDRFFSVPAASFASPSTRRIDARARRGLHALRRAIEYLSAAAPDQPIRLGDERIQAVALLMALHRQIYLECPEALSLRQRWRAFASRKTA